MTCNKDRIGLDNNGCAMKSCNDHDDGDNFQTEDAQLLS